MIQPLFFTILSLAVRSYAQIEGISCLQQISGQPPTIWENCEYCLGMLPLLEMIWNPCVPRSRGIQQKQVAVSVHFLIL
ncbi:hypothetical protein T265_09447 [Opisthorchis viverrini]|uniref:Secreted protein n=1 Tax=Opisthorchis viverrini TaxID=6198 RepID=A0A074ZA59_OPIVI|nr:hypothetical protein T265_09447 [Opisthorchis viverrini]KER22472.1 hypothetical protein T265_09447 [Opisthorchis viverrini]